MYSRPTTFDTPHYILDIVYHIRHACGTRRLAQQPNYCVCLSIASFPTIWSAPVVHSIRLLYWTRDGGGKLNEILALRQVHISGEAFRGSFTFRAAQRKTNRLYDLCYIGFANNSARCISMGRKCSPRYIICVDTFWGMHIVCDGWLIAWKRRWRRGKEG